MVLLQIEVNARMHLPNLGSNKSGDLKILVYRVMALFNDARDTRVVMRTDMAHNARYQFILVLYELVQCLLADPQMLSDIIHVHATDPQAHEHFG